MDREKNFLDLLENMKLYMDDEKGGVEEVAIPIEYFAQHEVIEDAVKNCILKYNKYNYRMNAEKLEQLKLENFEVLQNKDGNNYLEFQYSAKEGEEPYRVDVTGDRVDGFALKISVDKFLQEIDLVLQQREVEADEELNRKLQSKEISRSEWIKLKTELLSDFPQTAEEYMEQSVGEFKRYYEHITDRPEYKQIFADSRMSTLIAKDTMNKPRLVSGRGSMERVSEIMPFSERDEFLRSFTSKKSIRISDQENPDEEVYRGYIIDEEKEDGKIIVLEPIDGERTTFITFKKNEDINALEVLLRENDEDRSAYEYIISNVLSKTRSEKAHDDKIVSKYHVSGETYKKNLEFMITGNKDLGITYVVKNERREMLER